MLESTAPSRPPRAPARRNNNKTCERRRCANERDVNKYAKPGGGPEAAIEAAARARASQNKKRAKQGAAQERHEGKRTARAAPARLTTRHKKTVETCGEQLGSWNRRARGGRRVQPADRVAPRSLPQESLQGARRGQALRTVGGVRTSLTSDPVAETRCRDPTHTPFVRQMKGKRGGTRTITDASAPGTT